MGINHYQDLMDAARHFIKSNGKEYYYGDNDDYGSYPYLQGIDTDDEFWEWFEIVEGKSIPKELKTNFFTCSC